MRIVGETQLAKGFFDEWNSPSDYIVAHTSGSTGKPKEIRLLKSDMMISAKATCEFFHLTPKSVIVCPLSCEYIAGKMMAVRAIAANCTLIFEQPSNHPLSPSTLDLVGGNPIALLPIVPSQAKSLVEFQGQVPDISNIIVGGAPLSPEVEADLAAKFPSCWATYGMTETCSHVAIRKLATDTYIALPHITFDTTEDNRLIIKSALMSWGTLVTNDIVSLRNPHEFQWLGRADNVINSGGVKLHPEIIERELSAFITAPFYVKGVPDTTLGTALQLVVEADPAKTDTTQMLRLLKASDLHPYHIPRSIIAVSQLPRTSSGKIIRE